MDSPIPPDPYTALGVPKDADTDAIKKAYRKLALKLHPDKCTDESQKASRTEQFTQIQQAYDIIGDDEKRGRYDAEVRLAELRRQNMEMRGGARPDVRTSAYNTRTAAPREATYTARGPPRASYEPPPRPRHFENDYEPSRGSTRKASMADEYVYVKRPSPREEKREKVRVTVDPRDEDRRRDAKRREAEVRDARSTKYADYDDDKRRRERDYENIRQKADTYDSYGSSTERITEERMREAQKHMGRQSMSSRPGLPRRESSRQVPMYEPDVRRSAAAPKEKERARESRRTSPSKDERRRMAENFDTHDRRVPSMSTHNSSPPVMENIPPPPHRSYTTPTNFDAKKKKAAKDVSPPPAFVRATTQPNMAEASVPSSSKRKDTSSKLRGEDSGHSSPAATPGYSSAYAYADERAAPHVSYSNGRRTVLREPASSSSRRRSPSPVRVVPSKGAVKMKDLDPKSVKRTTQYSYAPGQPVGAEAISKGSSRRDRDSPYTERPIRQAYFGEGGVGTIDPQYPQPSPYEADIRHAVPRREHFEKPSVVRSATYAY